MHMSHQHVTSAGLADLLHGCIARKEFILGWHASKRRYSVRVDVVHMHVGHLHAGPESSVVMYPLRSVLVRC